MANHYFKRMKVDKNRSKLILIFILVITSGILVQSQDIHFTQFDFNPIFLNPANTGNFIGDWRVAGNFRNQWSGTANPYNTATVSADMPVYLMGQKVGAGIMLGSDVSGPGQLTYNFIYGSAGYSYEVSNNYFYGGIQAGVVFGALNDWYNWNHNEGEFNAPSGENLTGNSSYIDVNLGFIWKRNINIFEPEVGLSINHLNAPKITYTDGDENVDMRMNFYVTSKTKISDEIYVTPKIYYSGMKGSALTILGAEGGYNLLGNRSSVKRIFGGAYLRNGIASDIDALMVQVGATVGRLDVAVSYDLGMSNLSQSKTMSSFEISFIYKSISTVLNSYSIPCERY